MSLVNRAARRARGLTRRAIARATTPAAERRALLVGRTDTWEQQRKWQFDFLTSQGLAPEHRLVDVGCGTLRGGIPLIDYLQTGHYTGIEARAQVLREARKELAEAGLKDKQPQLLHAEDPAEVKLGAPCDYAWAFMVMIHMPDEIAAGYLKLMATALAPNGAFYANVKLGEHKDGFWQGFPVVTRAREFYEGLARDNGLEVTDVGLLADLGHKLGIGGDDTMMLRFARPGATAASG